jgi:tRNA 5-methylaminomethyl-2-thiouridine biosynthesis bifunctional protein
MQVAVVGGGVAGLFAARALLDAGARSVVHIADDGASASSVPWAVVQPVLGIRATMEPMWEEAGEAWARMEGGVPATVRGVLRLPTNDRQAARWRGRRDAWPSEVARWVDADEAAGIAEHAQTSRGGIDVIDGRAFSTAPLLAQMAARLRGDARYGRHGGRVVALRRRGSSWEGCVREGVEERWHRADAWVLAAGDGLRPLFDSPAWLVPVCGAVVSMEVDAAPRGVVGWHGSVIPTGARTVQVGSTYETGGVRLAATDEDRRVLSERARAALPGSAVGAIVDTWAGVRVTTADHEPVVGETSCAGVHVIGGVGSRGWLLAPFAACAVAARVMRPDAESVLPARWDPRRWGSVVPRAAP